MLVTDVHPPDAEHATRAATADPHRSSSLFGRDLLYVVVLSLQLVSATVVSPVLAHVLPGVEFGRFKMKKLLIALALSGGLVLSACNTVHGAANDVDSVTDCADGVDNNC